MIIILREKYNKLSAPVKAALWFTVCNFVLKGISFISGPLFTRILSSEEYGKYSVFLSYEQIILILATWEIQIGSYQKGIFKYKDNIQEYTSATQLLTNFLTIILFIIIFICQRAFVSLTGMNKFDIIFLFLYLVFRPAYDCWLAQKRKDYNYKPAVMVTLLYSIANVIIPLLALFVFERTANVKFETTLATSALICFFLYLPNANYRKILKKIDKIKDYWNFNITFGAPLVLHSLSFLVLSQSDRIMISKMAGNSQAAFYSVAYSIASVVTIIQNSINQSMVPWQYQKLEEGELEKVKNVFHSLLLIFAIAIIAFLLIIPEAIKILFTSSYYEAIWCIPPITVGIFFMFLYSIFVNVESYYENTQYIMYVSITCAIINVILNYFGIKIFGYIACAYTTLISYILFAIGHYLFMKKVLRKNLIKKNIVNPIIVILVSVGAVVTSIIITILYTQVVIRYLILTIVIIVTLIFKNKILLLFSSIRK